MALALTDEQLQVLVHPDGHHARVLSVAGSGKTTTMAHRIRHLIQERGVERHQIQVLMFNAAARKQFQQRLEDIGVPPESQPPVDTFHSYSYKRINIQGFKQWLGDTEELHYLRVKESVDRIRSSLAKKGEVIDDDNLDVNAAERAIGLWKGALIRPSDAGYEGPYGDAYVAVYRDYERVRLKENAITFDDFVPLAVQSLTVQRGTSRNISKLRYIIVDEYQDVNLGQQKLIEILASGGADVMVVGDDDQTIYEWRGATAEYILGEFANVFDNKPQITYRLTNSFRFGFMIAQASHNVVAHNTKREIKDLTPSDPSQDSEINVIVDAEIQDDYSNRALATELISLVIDKGVKPLSIRVLGRTFAQLTEFQSELLLREVPFVVEGHGSFLQAGECQAMLDYLRVAYSLNDPPESQTIARLVNIANKPSRFLPREGLRLAIEGGLKNQQSLLAILRELSDTDRAFGSKRQQEELTELTAVLESLAAKLVADSGDERETKAGPILRYVDESVGYVNHYLNYYGEGEQSQNRISAIETLMQYADRLDIGWQEFIEHSERSDTTLGRPADQCVTMTTIHRVKGLEFDYVFIPNCEEGHMPVIASNDDPTYDKREPRRAPNAAEWVESERRLFYVGATRAKRGLFIGAPKLRPVDNTGKSVTSAVARMERKGASSRFLEEMELEPTREVAIEVVKAARKQPNKLAEMLQQQRPFHALVKGVKNLGRFFSQRVRRKVAAVEPDGAERPFAYKQAYSSPAKSRNDEEGKDEQIWGHINLRRPQVKSATPRRSVLPPKRTI